MLSAVPRLSRGSWRILSTWQQPHAFLLQDEPQKQVQDPAKSPQAKEEGSMNILNSHSPKHENNRPTSVIHDQGHAPNNAEEYTEVNMLQNNLV